MRSHYDVTSRLTDASLMIIITVTVEFDLKVQMISSHLKTTFAFNILLSFDTSSEKDKKTCQLPRSRHKINIVIKYPANN